MTRTHFLHIGKSGGTAIKHALRDSKAVANGELILHPHATAIKDIPGGERIIFFLRNPLARFYSGYYSRLRKGKPRYSFEWTVGEKEAFETFRSPEHLIFAAMDSSNTELQSKAHAGLRSIQHVRDHLDYWLGSIDNIRARESDILHIGFQETLAEDFVKIKRKLGLESSLILPESDVESHKNPSYFVRDLTENELQFFRCWYAKDYDLIDYCKKIISSNAVR